MTLKLNFTDGELDQTEENANLMADEIAAQVHHRKRSFVTGDVIATAVIVAVVAIAMHLSGDYTGWYALAAGAIVGAPFGIGAYVGFDFANEAVVVRYEPQGNDD